MCMSQREDSQFTSRTFLRLTTGCSLVGYDEDDGRAELEFDDPFDPRSEDFSLSHSIWVDRKFIARIQS